MLKRIARLGVCLLALLVCYDPIANADRALRTNESELLIRGNSVVGKSWRTERSTQRSNRSEIDASDGNSSGGATRVVVEFRKRRPERCGGAQASGAGGAAGKGI